MSADYPSHINSNYNYKVNFFLHLHGLVFLQVQLLQENSMLLETQVQVL